MKKTKTRILCVLLSLALCLTALCLTACGGEIDSEGKCTVVLAEGGAIAEYEVPLSSLEGGKGAIAALDYLVADGKITYLSTDIGYGVYLTEVVATDGSVSVKEDGSKDKYVYIYTSVEADYDVSEYAQSVNYKDGVLVSSGVGISEMSLPDGAVIYISTIIYG